MFLSFNFDKKHEQYGFPRSEKYLQNSFSNKWEQNKMCLWNTNALENGQLQRWQRSQGQIYGYQ